MTVVNQFRNDVVGSFPHHVVLRHLYIYVVSHFSQGSIPSLFSSAAPYAKQNQAYNNQATRTPHKVYTPISNMTTLHAVKLGRSGCVSK